MIRLEPSLHPEHGCIQSWPKVTSGSRFIPEGAFPAQPLGRAAQSQPEGALSSIAVKTHCQNKRHATHVQQSSSIRGGRKGDSDLSDWSGVGAV